MMTWKSFKNRQNDKKLVPRLFILSYALVALGLIIYLYLLACDTFPSGKVIYHPDWAIFEGGSLSSEMGPFELADKEAAQLLFIAPLFLVFGSLLKMVGNKRL